MNDINVGKKSWSDLLERHDFFLDTNFICVLLQQLDLPILSI